MPPVRRYATLTFLRGALVSLVITLLAGFLGVIVYIPGGPELMRSLGLEFASLRPLHTTFASAWIFLGGIAVVHHFLQDRGGPVRRFERGLLAAQVTFWGVAGAGILVTLLMGISSGREYMGFHPIFSIPILLGWVCFGINFMRATARGFFHQPVYVTMWGVGIFFFIFTFAEQHAWLLPGVFEKPVVDIRVQWKACGTLVGAFNLFVYGSLYYIGERISGDDRYAHSWMAYGLFGVGLLNSFTNFAHHTYHVPQSPAVKWIAFVVSMMEIVILARVVWDLAAMVRNRIRQKFHSTRFFLTATKWWTMAILFTAIIISIPPLNSLIHGTHVVTAHAMGSEVGIDSMVLFAALSFIFAEMLVLRGQSDALLHTRRVRNWALGFNIGTALLVIWLNFSGSVVGYLRYNHQLPPAWLQQWNPYLFGITGSITALFLAFLLSRWLPLAFGRDSARFD